MADDKNRDVYLEFTVVGAAVRVSAIDSATGIEVVAMGPASARKPTCSSSRLAN